MNTEEEELMNFIEKQFATPIDNSNRFTVDEEQLMNTILEEEEIKDAPSPSLRLSDEAVRMMRQSRQPPQPPYDVYSDLNRIKSPEAAIREREREREVRRSLEYDKLYEQFWKEIDDDDILFSETLENRYNGLKSMFQDKKSEQKINREINRIKAEMKDEMVRARVDSILLDKSVQNKWENQKKILDRMDINKIEYDSNGKPIFTTFANPTPNWSFRNNYQARYFLSKDESSQLDNLTKNDLERYKNEVIDNVIEDLVDSADYEKQVDDVIESMVKTSREPISLYQTKDYFKLFGEPQSLWDIERKNPFI